MRLALNLCTRGRPELMAWTLFHTLQNIRDPNTVLMVSADEDDEKTIEAARIFKDRIHLNIKPREDALGDKYNRVLEVDADLYSTMCDYVPHATPGFDVKLLQAASVFPDGIGVVFTRLANTSFTTYQGVTKRMTQELGYLYPPYFPYWFVDHWIDDLAKMIGRFSFADVQTVTEPNRKTQEFREPGYWATLFDACAIQRREEANRLLDLMDEPQWRKDMLRANFGLHEQRSVMVNDFVRGMDWTPSDGGDRYNRVKVLAQEKLAGLGPALLADWKLHEAEINA